MPSRPLMSKDATMAGVCVLAVLSIIVAIFNYFSPANGIHGTGGALLVVISTVLLLIGAVIVATRWGPGWLRAVLEILIFLDFVGTAGAAYLLEAWILLALMVIAFLIWVAHLMRRSAPHPVPRTAQS